MGSWGGIFCIGLVCPGASRYFGTFVRIGGYCITRTVELGCGDWRWIRVGGNWEYLYPIPDTSERMGSMQSSYRGI